MIKNIILTGGCALNCTANGKLLDRNWFERVYVSPFPGDESIGHGCAAYGYSRQNADKWRSVPFENQHSFFGLERKVLTKNEIIEIIPKSGYEVKDIGEDYFSIVQLLQKGEVICWFQGRSECGPRALGHRSILALPTRPHLKNYLNNHIKFRESFRPYGSSVLWEAASQYFEIDQDFENPFMSFAVKAKPEFGDMLKEVCHVDGTSRMQTVRKESNPRFHHLLKEVGKTCGHPILLNTSFNKMGEPIVETFEDAFSFLRDSAIHYLIYENFLVIRK